jgi:hypothetical protein
MPPIISCKIVIPDPRPVMATRSPARYTGPSDEVRAAALKLNGRACARCHRPIERLRRWTLWRLGPRVPGVQDEPGGFMILCGTARTGCRGLIELGFAHPDKAAPA